MYRFSGWIRTEEVADMGHGANLSVEGVYSFSEELFGTMDWTYVELYGETGEDQDEIVVMARLGGYSGESRGRAYFTRLQLEQVERVPDGVVADLWFRPVIQTVDMDEDEEDTIPAPAWPWLSCIALLWIAVLLCILPVVTTRSENGNRRHPVLIFFLLAIASFVLQLWLSLKVTGYQVDVGCFLSWGRTMAEFGAPGFYQATSFCDYPPAYVYVLGLCDRVCLWLEEMLGGQAAALQVAVYKFIPNLCNIAAAYVVFRMAREKKFDHNQSLLMACLLLFNPVLILNSAAWCQMDSVMCLALMLVAYLAMQGRWMWVMPVYMLAVLIKPQALMLGPLGLLAIVMTWLRQKETRKGMLIGVAAALAVAGAVLIPFSLHQEWNWVLTLYGKTLASYPYATVNTANYWYLFHGNWSPIDNPAALTACVGLSAMSLALCLCLLRTELKRGLLIPACGVTGVFALFYIAAGFDGLSWGTVGTVIMIQLFLMVLAMYLSSDGVRCLPLLGGVLFLLLYVLGVKMHERYLFPALFFLVMAFLEYRDRRILLLLAVVTATMFVNEGVVLDNSLRLGSSMGHLNQDTYWLNMGLSVLNVATVPYALIIAWDLCVRRRAFVQNEVPIPLIPVSDRNTVDPASEKKSASPKATILQKVLFTVILCVYSFVALCNLGSFKAPQHAWKSTDFDETVVIDLGTQYDEFYMLYFARVCYDDFCVSVSDDGENWSPEVYAEMAEGQCYRWKYACNYTEYDAKRSYNSNAPREFSGRYVRIRADQVGLILNEVIFRTSCEDADTQIVLSPAAILSRTGEAQDSPLLSDPAALLDEQNTLEGQPSWYNGTYFDEIYHARTAYEFLEGTRPYETTHPPLGKLLMSACIAVFGMTPFGWRLAGALMGILMLPYLYAVGKRLTGKCSFGLVCMSLMALDCMHLTQTRIATIDSFPVCFIIMAFYYMLRFMQRDIRHERMQTLLKDLLLSGLSIGLAIASKWIGLYAGAGLALLYFWTCLRHLLDGRRESAQAFSEALRRVMILCGWCVLFFVVVPVTIYAVSYIPYFAYARIHGIGDFFRQLVQSQVNMYNYHSTPGLGMDHPFYSPWYEWPVIARPMYYANDGIMPDGLAYAIFCFGNPAVWLGC